MRKMKRTQTKEAVCIVVYRDNFWMVLNGRTHEQCIIQIEFTSDVPRKQKAQA